MQDKETGRETCRADVYLKVHTNMKTNKTHPIAESLMVDSNFIVKFN